MAELNSRRDPSGSRNEGNEAAAQPGAGSPPAATTDINAIRALLRGQQSPSDGGHTSPSSPVVPHPALSPRAFNTRRAWTPKPIREEPNYKAISALKELLLETLASIEFIQDTLQLYIPTTGAGLPITADPPSAEEVSPSFSLFSDLPAELRQKIFLLVLPGRSRQGRHDARNNAAGTLPSLALVCKEAYGLLHSPQFWFNPPSLQLERPRLIYPQDLISLPNDGVPWEAMNSDAGTTAYQDEMVRNAIVEFIKARGFGSIEASTLYPQQMGHLEDFQAHFAKKFDMIRGLDYVVVIIETESFSLPLKAFSNRLASGLAPKLARVVELDDTKKLSDTLELMPSGLVPGNPNRGPNFVDERRQEYLENWHQAFDQIKCCWIQAHCGAEGLRNQDLFPSDSSVNLDHPVAKQLLQSMPEMRPAVRFRMDFKTRQRIQYEAERNNAGNRPRGGRWRP